MLIYLACVRNDNTYQQGLEPFWYESRPYLSPEWIESSAANIGRTLAVQDENLSDQFIADFKFNEKWTRLMPVYSIPGLIDHY